MRDAKGAWLLAMLEDYVGRDRFSQALKAYVKEYGKQRVYPEFEDFVALVGRETGEDLDWFIRGWYENDGERRFDFSGAKWTPAYGDEGTLQFELKQEGFVERLPVDVALTLVDGSVVTDTVWVEPGENQLELPVDGDGCPVKLELDPELNLLKSPDNVEYSGMGSRNLLVFDLAN